jgi:hypothetical protein
MKGWEGVRMGEVFARESRTPPGRPQSLTLQPHCLTIQGMKWTALFPLIFVAIGCENSPELSAPAATAEQAIVNGTREPQAVELSDSQIMAIGWLHSRGNPSGNFCTGTLVAPNVVATAAHCTRGSSGSDLGFGVGLDPTDYDDTFASVAIYEHPSRDVSIVVLAEDATDGEVAITPIPINTRAYSSADVGTAVQAGGYGQTRDSSRSGRWFATVYISSVTNETIFVDGRGEQGICYGDSGGPIIGLADDGNPVVLATESTGDSSCVDIDQLTRLACIIHDTGIC